MDTKVIEINSDNSNADESLQESNKQKAVEKVIQKWLTLQKTIKEEITLEEVIIRHQQNEFTQLKDYFKQYYQKILESRKIYEEIKNFQNNSTNKVREMFMERELEHVFLDICEPIKNLLFLFRNNYDYIITLVSLISEYDEEDKISSLVELFCNQFYENILISNPEQEELLLLVYKLLEREIAPMNFASIDEFLNDDSFLGKFISSFLKRQEVKLFLSTLINPFINDIENNSSDNYLGMSLYAIKDFIFEKNKNKSIPLDNQGFNDLNEIDHIIFKNIPKSSITFKKKNKSKKNELDPNKDDKDNNKNKEEEEEEDDQDDSESEENIEEIVENWKKSIHNEFITQENEFNDDYEFMLDLDYLDEKVNQESNEVLKNFYLYELEQITSDPDIYSNRGLLEIIKEKDFKDNREEIVNKYKNNFIFIKNKIDSLIQSLINKIDSIPYSVRCICKVISLLLQQKFPSLFKYLRNSFIGKFIFDKYIFPALSLENKNVLEPKILSSNTKKCLNEIICVLKNANKCLLFNYNIDTEKTIFNHYLIEMIPLLNKFYGKLIDIELSPVLDGLINKTKKNIELNIGNKIHNFRKKKKINPQQNVDIKKNKVVPKEKETLYNYFNQHNDELIHLQCICFSLDDILFILTLIGRNIQAFSGLPDFTFFERTYEFIQPSDYKLDQENSRNPDQKKFFIIFKDEKNSNLEKLIKKNKKTASTFASGEKDADLICQRIKFCIKTVLKGLNLLNNKDYAHLNMAMTNKKFFSSLKFTLDDFGEISEVKNKIPLKWYGQYIYNNKDALESKYKNGDYSLLYDEIYNEELNTLNELKSFSSIIITRDGMNVRCAENILKKVKYDLSHMNQSKEFAKIEKFIEEEEIEVCIQTSEIKNLKERDNKKKKNNKSSKKDVVKETVKNDKIPLFITDEQNCYHKPNKPSELYESDKNKNLIPYHAYSIKQFISKFSEYPWKEEKDQKYIFPRKLVLEDIYEGNRSNKIFKSINLYMDIIKKHIKNPKTNKNLYGNDFAKNCNSIAEKIKDYILRHLYVHVYPADPSDKDTLFYQQTEKLSWITPEHLNIKKIYINQLSNAVMWIKKVDTVKSVNDKLYCLNSAYNTMNNTIKFSTGKTDAETDELTQILRYIIIKAQPKRMFSNINYIKCFLDDSDLKENLRLLLIQMESTTEFILNYDNKELNMSK